MLRRDPLYYITFTGVEGSSVEAEENRFPQPQPVIPLPWARLTGIAGSLVGYAAFECFTAAYALGYTGVLRKSALDFFHGIAA